MNWNIDIQIEKPFSNIQEEWLKAVVNKVLLGEAIDVPVELSILITDDEIVQDLNLKYRRIDKTTDVLAFSMQEGEVFPIGEDEARQLGEVIISYPQAKRQAAEHNNSIDKEIAILTIHGILHLLGYDHEDDESEHKMLEREQSILLNQKIEE